MHPEYLLLAEREPYIILDDEFNVPKLRERELSYMIAVAKTVKPNPNVIETDRRVPVRDGTSIPVRLHSPRKPPTGGSPIFVMLHSGGYCIGGLNNRLQDCRMLVEKWGFVVVNIDYRLAPEHPFPTAVYDAYDVVRWTAANYEEIGANPAAGFIVGGNSTGATLGAIIALLARDEELNPPLTGQLLSIPSVVDPSVVPKEYEEELLSREQNADAPYYLNKLNSVFQGRPSFSFCFVQGHQRLTESSCIQSGPCIICGLDPARDDGFIYDQALRNAGVKTRVDVYPGLPHAFWAFLPQLEATRQYEEDLAAGIEWLLDRGRAADVETRI
ncbi:alpha/beta hydrolase [Aspergillus lucknowensis]|uniref:Alpha/Beta hydrolase protein n=1 Tax=Aspergillus lucknowensis TaxID=176173 RepID=A0ABR4LI75_9EURO